MILLDKVETLISVFRNVLELRLQKQVGTTKQEIRKVDDTLVVLLGLQREIDRGSGVDGIRFKQIMFLIEGHIHRHYREEGHEKQRLVSLVALIKKLEGKYDTE